MLNSIKSLFDDPDRFAQFIAKTDLVKLTFEHYELLRNHMAIDLILSPKNQYQDIQEAFASLFCKELHNMHEWDITKQYAYDDKEWLMALKDIWIPENFLKYPGLQVEMENASSFIKSVELDFQNVHVPSETANDVLKKISKNPTVIRLQKRNVYDQYFGESEAYYFLYEWGIYS